MGIALQVISLYQRLKRYKNYGVKSEYCYKTTSEKALLLKKFAQSSTLRRPYTNGAPPPRRLSLTSDNCQDKMKYHYRHTF